MTARLFWLTILLLAACTTAGEPAAPAVPLFVLPFTLTTDGHLVIKGRIADSPPLRLLIDTGSTRTGLTEGAARRIGIWPAGERNTLVRGLQSQETRPVVDAAISLGTDTRRPQPLIVLENRRRFEADGILGMDVLGRYGMLVDAAAGTIAFGTDLRFAEDRLAGWERIRLIPSPRPLGAPLPFAEMRTGRDRFPMLLDTGSPVNVVNEALAREILPGVLKPRRFREAIEDVNAQETKPPALIVYGLRLGEARWERLIVIVLPLEPLDVIGAADGPFAIGGIDLFEGRSFALDHEAGRLLVCPETKQAQAAC